jgi:23S rRNA (cytidine1920-2'-O)/16S rRNA (cytidine1409-2'-O)-methyltransferase
VARVPRTRLDQLLLARGLAESRNTAQGLIMAGLVQVDGRVVDKAGTAVREDADLHVKERPRFVSRAGEKLAGALADLGVEVTGARALDLGASTGGFTDCLLQGGAARVIALDVGYGQLDSRLRRDERVTVLERVNARYLECSSLPYAPDLLTADVSFISLEKVLPAVTACMAPVFRALLLLKPQFEAGPERVGKGGIVRDRAVHREVILRIAAFLAQSLELELWGVTRSGLPGVGGNQEFFLYAGRGRAPGLSLANLEVVVDAILSDGSEAK